MRSGLSVTASLRARRTTATGRRFLRRSDRRDGRMCRRCGPPRVERFAGGEERAQVRHRLRVIGHRPSIALPQHAVPVIFGLARSQIVRRDRRSSANVSAAVTSPPPVASTIGRWSRALPADVAFETAIVILAVEREELGQAQIRGLLDSTVELDKRHAQSPGEPSADGGLAGAAQAEKSDDRFGSSAGNAMSDAGVTSSARATSASRRTEMLPRPASSWTRKRGDTPDRSATSRNVQPRLQPSRTRTLAKGSQQVRGISRTILRRRTVGVLMRASHDIACSRCDGALMRHAHRFHVKVLCDTP